MQKVLQHLMDLLTNHLSSEDNACLGQVGAAGPHRGLPAGACAPDRATYVAEAPPEPVPGAGVGAPAGLLASVSQGVDVTESRVGFVSGADVCGIPYPPRNCGSQTAGCLLSQMHIRPKCPNLTNPGF